MAFAMSAHAVDWHFEPSVGASATYTDNVDQSPTDAEDAIILTVTPGFTLQSQGSRRVEATMGYYLSGVARFGGGNDNDLNHNLNAVGHAEVGRTLAGVANPAGAEERGALRRHAG